MQIRPPQLKFASIFCPRKFPAKLNRSKKMFSIVQPILTLLKYTRDSLTILKGRD